MQTLLSLGAKDYFCTQRLRLAAGHVFYHLWVSLDKVDSLLDVLLQVCSTISTRFSSGWEAVTHLTVQPQLDPLHRS